MIVNVKQGSLRGGTSESILTGKKYYYFTGIPYAEPPVRNLRFQPPVPKRSWRGVRDATVLDSRQCTQKSKATVVGSEDCLYLNVYTPEPPNLKGHLKPVMVYIHGGAFSTGSGGNGPKGADFLINYGVILVTLNYRLHVLGFLNLNIPSCRGNCGLKDQSLALKWIKENIQEFGGDAENITIFGESAGSTSVHFHLISPMSKSLVKRGIVQSGGAFVGWAIRDKPEKYAFRLGKLLGYDGNDPEALVAFLKKQPADDLCTGASTLMKANKAKNPWRLMFVPFAPTVEKIQENAFLPASPSNLVENLYENLAFVSGVTMKEGIVMLSDMPSNYLDLVQDNIESVIKGSLCSCDPTVLKHLAQAVKMYYFGNISENDKLPQFVNLCSDLYFLQMYDSIDYLVKAEKPVFFYQFTFSGMFNPAQPSTGPGPGHAEDVDYIFYNKDKFPNPIIGEAEKKVINNFCTLWTNFAKTEHPTPDPKKQDIEWKQFNIKNPSYMNINRDLKLEDGYIWGRRREFWTNLLKDVYIPNW